MPRPNPSPLARDAAEEVVLLEAVGVAAGVKVAAGGGGTRRRERPSPPTLASAIAAAALHPAARAAGVRAYRCSERGRRGGVAQRPRRPLRRLAPAPTQTTDAEEIARAPWPTSRRRRRLEAQGEGAGRERRGRSGDAEEDETGRGGEVVEGGGDGGAPAKPDRSGGGGRGEDGAPQPPRLRLPREGARKLPFPRASRDHLAAGFDAAASCAPATARPTRVAADQVAAAAITSRPRVRRGASKARRARPEIRAAGGRAPGAGPPRRSSADAVNEAALRTVEAAALSRRRRCGPAHALRKPPHVANMRFTAELMPKGLHSIEAQLAQVLGKPALGAWTPTPTSRRRGVPEWVAK